MAETVSRVQYFYMQVGDMPGQGQEVLSVLREAEVNLLAFSGFPQDGRSQLDFVPDDPDHFQRVAKRAGWEVVGPKGAFLIRGDDRVGVVADTLGRLAAAGINVTAMQAICSADDRFGAILWVKPESYNMAASALGAS